ncbi:MAG: hypothetical protein IH969_02055 [Candidatus Krumholzibacteriota bacterium]|nr:hypothetical protein [Candidatus Krumholzibacteriota bacterium]
MAVDLHKRHFLKLLDYTPEEILFLLELSRELKGAKSDGKEVRRLEGRNIALIFEKASTRTRCAFEVAAYDQGANVTYLGPSGSHIGKKETMKDTARVLGRMYDAIEYRGFGQDVCEELAAFAGVPVLTSGGSQVLDRVGSDPAVVVATPGAELVFFDPAEEGSMAEVIGHALLDAGARQSCIARGLARSREFTWETTAARTLEVIRTAAES